MGDSSLINFVALPEDVNALYPFSLEIFYLSILVQQKLKYFGGAN